MAIQAGVKVEGLANLTRTMRKAELDLSDLKDAAAAAGAIVVSAAAALAPRRSGRLAGTLRASRAVNRASVLAGRKSVPYGPPIHWGWPARNIESNPFVSRAARMTEPEWIAKWQEGVEKALSQIEGV